MKKLKKLTLKEMEIGMNSIGNKGLQEIRGGDNPLGWTYSGYQNYVIGQFEDCYEAVISSIGSAIDTAVDAVTGFYESREEAFSNLSWSAVEEAVTSWLNSLGGGNTPYGAPIIIINNPALYPSSVGSHTIDLGSS